MAFLDLCRVLRQKYAELVALAMEEEEDDDDMSVVCCFEEVGKTEQKGSMIFHSHK